MAPSVPPREHPLHDEILDVCLSYGPAVETISVGPLFGTNLRTLSVTGTLAVLIGRDLEITVWCGTRSGAPSKAVDQPLWVRIATTEDGKTEESIGRVGSDHTVALADEDERDWALTAVELLLDVLDLAGDEHTTLTGAALVHHYIQLNAACLEGLHLAREAREADYDSIFDEDDDEDDEDDSHGHAGCPHGEPWFADVDNFTAQCRYGFLRHLSLQESPYGAADVSAMIRPPGMDETVTVKVFTHQGDLEPNAGHWYAAGDGMCSAHGEDIDIVGLVSVFPVESQGFIAHSLEHLHSTAHAVERILQSRMDGIVEVVASVVDDGSLITDMAKRLYATEFADTIAGLNGIARLHTGAAREPLEP